MSSFVVESTNPFRISNIEVFLFTDPVSRNNVINRGIVFSRINLLAGILIDAQIDRINPAGRAILVSGSESSLEHVSVTTLRYRASGDVRVASDNPNDKDLVIAFNNSSALAEISSSFPFRISKRIVSHMDAANRLIV